MERLAWLLDRTRTLPFGVRLLGAAVIVALALGLRWALLGPAIRYPYLTFFPAAVAASALFGAWIGVLAALVTTGLGLFAVADAIGLDRVDAFDAAAAAVYLAAVLLCALLFECLRDALRRVAATEVQKDVLLRELVHRTRNDLLRLEGLLRLQLRAAENPPARRALLEVERRVWALARVNARLDALRDSGSVDVRDLLEELVSDLARTAAPSEGEAAVVRVAAESHLLAAGRAAPLGLIVNELVTNALKYAFAGREGTRVVHVGFTRADDEFTLVIEDNGTGFDPAAPPKGSGLGRRLVEALAGQLGGHLQVEPRPGAGTRCEVRFPAD